MVDVIMYMSISSTLYLMEIYQQGPLRKSSESKARGKLTCQALVTEEKWL